MKIFPFDQLNTADLYVDAIYEGGIQGGTSDDPLTKLMRCGNQGGFRIVGRGAPNYVVLYSSLEDRDWPDFLDLSTGAFTYFGDNKRPGHELHTTHMGGNRLLSDVYSRLHSAEAQRRLIPPFFVFTKYPTRSPRSVQFRGLAVPGMSGLASTDDLVAVWKSVRQQRFQNYRAAFTILDAAYIPRAWLDELSHLKPTSIHAPQAWTCWVETGQYRPLISSPTTIFRRVEEQLPQTDLQKEILLSVYEYFKQNPTAFEACAAEIVRLSDIRFTVDQITRASADGGRDAIGRYRLGPQSDPVFAVFALEAKCYDPGLGDRQRLSTVGVKEASRLISRIRHREFGVLVTTSAVSQQAYWEIRHDGHPIVILSGRDVADILISKEYNSRDKVLTWLTKEFPLT